MRNSVFLGTKFRRSIASPGERPLSVPPEIQSHMPLRFSMMGIVFRTLERHLDESLPSNCQTDIRLAREERAINKSRNGSHFIAAPRRSKFVATVLSLVCGFMKHKCEVPCNNNTNFFLTATESVLLFKSATESVVDQKQNLFCFSNLQQNLLLFNT